MATIRVDLPEPVEARLRRESQRVHLSISELVARSVGREFPCAICTAGQARQAIQRWLHAPVRPLLRVGQPTFEPPTEQWRVPVYPNARQGTPPVLGEVRLSAETGDLLTSVEVLPEWARQAAVYLGVEPFSEAFQDRLQELMTRQSTGTISAEDRQELEGLVAQWERHNLENARHLVENLHLPRAQRKEAEAREEQVQRLLAGSPAAAGKDP